MSDSPVVMWTSEWVTVGTKRVALPDKTTKEVPEKVARGDINPNSRLGKVLQRSKKDD